MRNKSLLSLMEQLVMLVVFALAAALCVQAFVLSDRMSHRCEERDRAMEEAQTAAEQIKQVRGEFSRAVELYGGTENGFAWGWSLDRNWKRTEQGPVYHVLVISVQTDTPLMGGAEISVYGEEGALLAALPVAWQEVDSCA